MMTPFPLFEWSTTDQPVNNYFEMTILLAASNLTPRFGETDEAKVKTKV